MNCQNSFENVPNNQRNAFVKKPIATDGLQRIFYQNDTGDSEVISYEVFPGIHLVYKFVHMAECPRDFSDSSKRVEIHYCQEGQLAWCSGTEYQSLVPERFAVLKLPHNGSEIRFPLGHYHGLSIIVEEDRVQQSVSYFLDEIGINPLAVAERLCNGAAYFSTDADSQVQHLFSGLCSIRHSHQKGFLKIKVLELLLALDGIIPEKAAAPVPSLPPEQAELANQIAEYLRAHVDRHITAEELSRQFHLSKTHLRNIFKRMYGIPVYSYIRIQKMQIAAIQLARTSMTVLEIANACGYTNASKFAATFREVMGQSPADYRTSHGILQADKQ